MRAGLTRHIGVCNMNEDQIARLQRVATIAPAVHQLEMHPYLRRDSIRAASRAAGMQLEAYSPLGNPGLGQGPSLLNDATVVRVARELSISPAQCLLAWSRQALGAQPIVKSVRPERIRENFASASIVLPQRALDELSSLATTFRYVRPPWWTHPASEPL